ncbi:MAG: transcription antitermination factor NusB [Christensenellales bacterium]
MSRKIAREYAYKLIFEYIFSKTPNPRTYQIFACADIDESDTAYLEKVYQGVTAKYDELIGDIERYSQSFAIDRIYKTDLSALLLAIYEMKYMDDIPLSVSISEAVVLVKKYSTEKSNAFVNGILSSVYKELTEKK